MGLTGICLQFPALAETAVTSRDTELQREPFSDDYAERRRNSAALKKEACTGSNCWTG